MTFTHQPHHIILTSYINTWHFVNNIITSTSLHTQTHETNSSTSSHHPHFMHKHMTLAQKQHHIILNSNTNTWQSLNNIIIFNLTSYTNTWHLLINLITSYLLHTQPHETHSSTSSYYPYFLHKHTTLTLQHHHIILTSYTNTRHSLNNIIT